MNFVINCTLHAWAKQRIIDPQTWTNSDKLQFYMLVVAFLQCHTLWYELLVSASDDNNKNKVSQLLRFFWTLWSLNHQLLKLNFSFRNESHLQLEIISWMLLQILTLNKISILLVIPLWMCILQLGCYGSFHAVTHWLKTKCHHRAPEHFCHPFAAWT